MNILITGGAGFIGSNLCERLLSLSHQVICLDNFDTFYEPRIKWNNLHLASLYANFKLVMGDIRNTPLLEEIFSNHSIDLVIHLAAKAGVRPSVKDPKEYFDVNVNGTLNLLETMRKFNVKKMLFASSSSVYGNSDLIPFREDHRSDATISPYAASKRSGELLCYNYHHLFNFNIFCFRFFTVYGPRQRPEMAIHHFVHSISKNRLIKVFGDGSSRRDYTFITDIVDGLVSAVSKVKGYEIINLGESQTISLSDLIINIENILGMKARIQRCPSQSGDVQLTFADISKAKALLDYDPRVPVEKGLQYFIEWYQRKHSKKKHEQEAIHSYTRLQ